MTSLKDRYIADLQRMDTDLRLGSLLFELHFEYAICPAMQKRKPGLEVSFGWMIGESNGKRVALKAVPPSPSQCDEVFAERLRKNGWKVVWLNFEGDRVSAKDDAANNPVLNLNRFGGCLSGMRQSAIKSISKETIVFFQSLPESRVEQVWRSRSLINGLMKAGCVSNIRDIDAVLLGKDKKLSVIEFKRKLPMKTFLPLPEAVDGIGLPADIFNSAMKYENGSRISGRHYGLDLNSHVRSVESMENAEIEFLYLILKSGETSASMLFDLEFQPLYTEPFLISEVTTASFKGITSTGGKHPSKGGQTRDQSGSFYGGKRYQLTIPEESFEPFRVFDRQI